MKRFYLLFIAIGMMLSGCGSTDVQAPKKENVQGKSIKKQSLQTKSTVNKSKIPSWVSNPDTQGYTGAVGVVKLMKNKKKQNYIAKKLAVAELQERKRVMMSSSVKNKDIVKNGKVVDSDSVHTVKQTSSHFNSDVIIQKAEYSDDGNYYVWMVIKQ